MLVPINIFCRRFAIVHMLTMLVVRYISNKEAAILYLIKLGNVTTTSQLSDLYSYDGYLLCLAGIVCRDEEA